MSSFGLGYKAIKSMCQSGTALLWYKAKFVPDMFRPGELEVYEYVQQHVVKHHALPHVDTLCSAFPDLQQYQVPEPPSYYLEHLESRLYYERINRANIDSQTVLKNNPQDTKQARAILQEALSYITAHEYRMKIVDLAKDAPTMVLTAYHSLMLAENVGEFGWPYLDKSSGGLMPGDVITFIGRPAAGKAQPLTSKVLTTKGFKPMGEIKVGDTLASVDGQPSHVTGVFPQGVKPVYRLTFQDGRTVEASDEHLWEVYYRDWSAPRIETTLQLIARLKRARYQGRLSVSLFTGEYGQQYQHLIGPYTMGCLLGDGSFRGKDPRFSSADPEVVERVRAGLQALRCELKYVNRHDYTVVCPQDTTSPLIEALKYYGLWGSRSEHKFIPLSYMHATRAQRLALLQGLMDTDGTAEKSGGVSFSSSSRVLAEQVQYLVRSLGGKCRVAVKHTKCLPSYRVHLALQNRAEAFQLQRKIDRVQAPRTTHTNHRLTLTSIEYVGEQECQCISVSHPRALYVSDNFVVTHNTWKVLYTALHNWRKGKRVMVVSMEMAPLPIVQRVAAMYAHTNINQLKLGGFSTGTYKKFVQSLQSLASTEQSFYVVDGNLAASVEDIYTLAAQLKIEQVYIDGAYLLRHPNKRLDRYTRVAENAELIKQTTSTMGCPTIASYQFARTATKGKQKGEVATLDDIGYSDVIGQVSTIALGLFQDDSVETMEGRVIRVLKGRNGEIGSFQINWNFQTMDFSEKVEESEQETAQLEYI